LKPFDSFVTTSDLLLPEIPTHGTALRLTIKANFSSVIVTIHNELFQKVLGEYTNFVWNRAGQLIAFGRELFHGVHVTPLARNGPGKGIFMNLQSGHVIHLAHFTGKGTFHFAIIDREKVCAG
jgi:hypothetical protein